MKHSPSPELISSIFAPIIYRPCWGAGRVHGSIVSMEFGSVAVPMQPSPVSLKRKARHPEDTTPIKMLGAKGEWNFTPVDAKWIIVANNFSAHYWTSSELEIDRTLEQLNGQTLINANWTPDSRLILSFAPNGRVEAGLAEYTIREREPDDLMWWLSQYGGPRSTLTGDNLIESE